MEFMKKIYLFSFLFLIPQSRALEIDQSILFQSVGYSKSRCEYGKVIRSKYFMGVKCLARNEEGKCQEILPFYAQEEKSHKNYKEALAKKTLTYDEVQLAYEQLKKSAGKDAHQHSPFISRAFMISNASGFAFFTLFPLTIALDLVTAPAQLGMYYSEHSYTTMKYKKIIKRLKRFADGEKIHSVVRLNKQKGFDYGQTLDEHFDFDGYIWTCLN